MSTPHRRVVDFEDKQLLKQARREIIFRIEERETHFYDYEMPPYVVEKLRKDGLTVTENGINCDGKSKWLVEWCQGCTNGCQGGDCCSDCECECKS